MNSRRWRAFDILVERLPDDVSHRMAQQIWDWTDRWHNLERGPVHVWLEQAWEQVAKQERADDNRRPAKAK